MVPLKTDQKPRALVTGAASSLGRAISFVLARAGYDLVLHYGKSKNAVWKMRDELEAEGTDVLVLQADLARPGILAGKIQKNPEVFSQVGLLVNNASLFEPTSSEVFRQAEWQRLLAVNLMAPYAWGSALRPALAKNKGAVVNITDIYGDHPRLSGHSAYCVSKGALITLTKFWASEWGPDIRVNAVSPGVITFPVHYSGSRKKRLTAKSALKKGGRPEDVAQAVLFLARHPFVTGRILPVDGGRFI